MGGERTMQAVTVCSPRLQEGGVRVRGFVGGALLFWRKALSFGSKLYLISTYSIQSTMNPAAHSKTQLKFRYEIQYTNEILDHDFFQFRWPNEGASSNTDRMGVAAKEEDPSAGGHWSSKNNRKKTQKEGPIILITNAALDGNNAVKMEEQEQSNQRSNDDKDHPKTPNKNTTPKKTRTGNGCLVTTAPKEARGSDEEEPKGRSSRKGLAWISSHILQLLEGEYRSENRFTCGQISEKVLTDFYSSGREKADEAAEEKEKKTIRRRVYDSINVLIALGKIKKAQKYLYVESIDRRIGEEIVLAKKDKLAAVRAELQRKEEMLATAKREHGKLVQLKARNEELSESKEQGYSGTFSTFSPGHNLFRFPLLLAYPEPGANMRIEASQEDGEPGKDRIIVSSEPFLYLLSDLSCLQYLSLRGERGRSRRREKGQ